jgi:hypothetical protein
MQSRTKIRDRDHGERGAALNQEGAVQHEQSGVPGRWRQGPDAPDVSGWSSDGAGRSRVRLGAQEPDAGGVGRRSETLA